MFSPKKSGAAVAEAPSGGLMPPVGRREFDRLYSDLAKGKRNWQIATFVSLGLLAGSTAGLIAVSLRSSVQPYIVEVDKLNQVAAYGPMEALDTPDERLIRAEISRFLIGIRSVYSDPVALRAEALRAMALLGPSAAKYVNDYFANPQTNPLLLGATLNRSVAIVAIEPPLGDAKTWGLKWTETDFPLGGGRPATSLFEGKLNLEVVPPKEMDGVLRNPLGIVITNIAWNRLRTEAADTTGMGEALEQAGTRRGSIAAPPSGNAGAPAEVGRSTVGNDASVGAQLAPSTEAR